MINLCSQVNPKSKSFLVSGKEYKQQKKTKNLAQGWEFYGTTEADEKDMIIIGQHCQQLINQHKSFTNQIVVGSIENHISTMKKLQEKSNDVSAFSRILGTEVDENFLYVMQEFCGFDGLTFILRKHELINNNKLSYDAWAAQVQQIMVQLVNGVAVLHQCSIAHCELSSENILLSEDYKEKRIRVKINNFEVAVDTTLTALSDKKIGKMNDSAPEIFGDTPYNVFKVDVWSLGALFFVLLFGKPLAPLLSRHENDSNQFDISMEQFLKQNSIDEKAKDLLKQLLTLDPEKRPYISDVQNHSYLQKSDDNNTK